jgi:hypothetical protein
LPLFPSSTFFRSAGDLAGVESIELHFPRSDTRTRRFVVHEIRLIERRSR